MHRYYYELKPMLPLSKGRWEWSVWQKEEGWMDQRCGHGKCRSRSRANFEALQCAQKRLVLGAEKDKQKALTEVHYVD